MTDLPETISNDQPRLHRVLSLSPLHPMLRPMVASLKSRSKDGYLLSGLTFNKYGDRSNAVGKRFGTMKDRLGFKET